MVAIFDIEAIGGRWFILRTSGGQTLALASSLVAAGHDAWTATRTLRKKVSAKTILGWRLIEVDVPILPTFVFIRAAETKKEREQQLRVLVVAGRQSPSPFPAFSVFQHANRAPMVADREIAGLRAEEAREAALIKAMHEAESLAEAKRIRLAEIQSASARRRAEAALAREQRAARRAEGTAVEPGAQVEVAGSPAFMGVYGVVESVEGHYVNVRFGAHSWKIEGWQVMPASTALRSVAA